MFDIVLELKVKKTLDSLTNSLSFTAKIEKKKPYKY